MKRILATIIAVFILCSSLSMPVHASVILKTEGEKWNFGFACKEIVPDEDSAQPLYIAGYNNGLEISGILDLCQVRALWLDTGEAGVLIIGIDCIALASGTVEKIRKGLEDIPGCASINVYATHTHAGADTLGLWGPVGVDGKNDSYMDALVKAAVEAGHEAALQQKKGDMYYGVAQTQDMYRDSRYPEVYDENLYQLRIVPDDGTSGVRMYFYGAHAESLRGDNALLSRDFPGMLCDGVQEATGDDAMFFPSAIGGLIMTRAFVEDTGAQAIENLTVTSEKLIGYALSISPENEMQILPEISISREVFTVPLDNTAFLMYKMLGILGNKAVEAESRTGYGVETELSIIRLGDIALTLIPGEIFPELVYGGQFADANPDGVNPRTLKEIAADHGISDILIVGLANDELGYIVPPSDFLVNEAMPYLARIEDARGEDHYEETNSVGPDCAQAIADAFERAADALV